MGEDRVRVRVVFEDYRHVLKKFQRVEGLDRCWILLRDHHNTISDLASHLIHTFSLNRSCPHGLLLSMDGFVLPSFEPTSIFKDRDIISVRKKSGTAKEIIKISEDRDYIQDSKIVRRQPIRRKKHLAIKEHELDSELYENKGQENGCVLHDETILSEDPPTENTKSKRKRKQLHMLQGSNGTKKGGTTKEIIEVDEDRVHVKDSDNVGRPRIRSGKLLALNEQLDPEGYEDKDDDNGCIIHDEKVLLESPLIENTKSKRKRKHSEMLHVSENDQVEKVCQRSACDPHVTGGYIGLPSRSSRRKKAKRKWRQENITNEYSTYQIPANGTHEESPKHQKMDEGIETEGEIVPVIVRPGHIRFEPIGAEQRTQQSNRSVESLQWNGTTSKKKGQKWGQEKTLSWSDNDELCNEEYIEKRVSPDEDYVNGHADFQNLDANETQCKGTASKEGQKWGQEKTQFKSINDKVCNEDIEKPDSGDRDHLKERNRDYVNGHADFEHLIPLTRIPKEGDMIVYRLVELSSSSWCPELSSFRVGKVAMYDSMSLNVILDPVPMYPIFLEGEEPNSQISSSYKDDGTLEIDYPSLVDVRLLGADRLEKNMVSTPRNSTVDKLALVNNREVATTNEKEKQTDIGWEQINQALTKKKAELQKKDGLGNSTPNMNTTTSLWSYRMLRRTALGPTVASLRAEPSR